MTGPLGYLRLFWLLPLGMLFAVFGAAVVANAERVWGGAGAAAALAAGLVLLLPTLGGQYVWGTGNVYFDHVASHRAENAFKVPDALLSLARELEATGVGPEARILCGERTAALLAPLALPFDFVYTRRYQTKAQLIAAGREPEALARERLARAFLAGEMSRDEAVPLLTEQRVAHVVVSSPPVEVESALAAAGFARQRTTGEFAWWHRPPTDPATTGRRSRSTPPAPP